MTRRAALAAVAAPALVKSGVTVRFESMFLALNSVLVSGRVKWPEFARLAAKVHFPGTDIMLQSAMQDGAEATNELLSRLNLRPAAIDLPVDFRKDDATFQGSLEQLDAAARFAAAIHCPRMVTYIMPSSDTPKAELRATYKERFTRIASVLHKYNVRLGLEFLGPLELRKKFKYEFIWRMNEMLEFAKECGPNVGLLLD
ncbi:MAG: TIM barrel protein, partial [Acidobacteriaceae bacterium]|nr:TIM barrel protein [Acidobacteriaceae bacterium]